MEAEPYARRSRRRGVIFARQPSTLVTGGVNSWSHHGIRKKRDVRRTHLRPAHDQVLAVLRDQGPCETKVVAEALSIEWPTAEHLLRELDRNGFANRIHGY